MNNIEKLKTEIENSKKRLQEECSKILAEELKNWFDKYNGVDSVSVKAYTVYFNDGDTCTYSVYSDQESLTVNGYAYDAFPWYSQYRKE